MNNRDGNFVLRPNKHVLYSVSMSSKRSKKADPEEIKSESGLGITQSPQDDDQDPDDLEEEFSLDQLSQAYAEVLRSRDGGGDDEEPEVATAKDVAADAEEDSSNNEDRTGNDNSACPISPESIVESILFVGCPKDVKLTSKKIAAVLRDVSPKEVTKIVKELNQRYENEDAAYRIGTKDGELKLILDPELLGFQQDFFGRNRKVRLSQSVIDVMAIVAYNQPATREQVDKIRGKSSGSVLKQLVKREILIAEPGKTEPKISYYSTTDRFLDLFSLDEIADLPQSHEVSDIEELAD